MVALSDIPLGDLERYEGRIYIERTLEGEIFRFGGFSEADLARLNVKLDKEGTLFIIDRAYRLRQDGKNEYTLKITPRLFQFLDFYYGIAFEDGWREKEPKHGLPIWELQGWKGQKNNPDIGYLHKISKAGPIRMGIDSMMNIFEVGNWLDDIRGFYEQISSGKAKK